MAAAARVSLSTLLHWGRLEMATEDCITFHIVHSALSVDPTRLETLHMVHVAPAEGVRKAWGAVLEMLNLHHRQKTSVFVAHDGHESSLLVGATLLSLTAHGCNPNAQRYKADKAILAMARTLRSEELLERYLDERLGKALFVECVDFAKDQIRAMEWARQHMALILGTGRKGEWSVYVGDRYAAKERRELEARGVTRIVNCGVAHRIPCSFRNDPTFKYVCFDSNDQDRTALYPGAQWPCIMDFLQQARQESRAVLVHCVAGMNRSVVTLALWMVVSGLSSDVNQAVEHISRYRPQARVHQKYRDWGIEYLTYGPSGQPPAEGSVTVQVVEKGAHRLYKASKRTKKVHKAAKRVPGT